MKRRSVLLDLVMFVPFMASMIFVVALWLISGVAVSEATRFAEEGVTAEAEVTAMQVRTEEQRTTDSQGRTSTTFVTRYLVSYSFVDQEGNPVEGIGDVSSGFYGRLDVGDVVRLVYVRSDPGMVELESGTRAETVKWMALAFWAALVAAVVALAVPLWFLMRRRARARYLRQNGVRRTARITGHVATILTVNGQTQYAAEWLDSAGATGQSRVAAPGQLPDIGSDVTIRADPKGVVPAMMEADLN